MKISVDASINGGGLRAGCGGIARNHCGDFIFGFEQKIGSSSSLEDELKAIFGVRLALDRGFLSFVVESNSQEAINSVLVGVSLHYWRNS